MLNPYHQRIDVRAVLELQEHQYQTALYLQEVVPASSQLDAAVQITSVGEFMLTGITGGFSTLDAEDTDDGICRIYAQLVDGTNNTALMDNFIYLPLWFSPGRQKLAAGAVGAASEPVRIQFPWVHTFSSTGQITVRIRNDAAYANKVWMMFHGIRIYDESRSEH